MKTSLSASFLAFLTLSLAASCRPKSGAEDSSAASLSNATVIAIRSKSGSQLKLTERSRRSLLEGVECRIELDGQGSELKIVPRKKSESVSADGNEYFVQLLQPIDANKCGLGPSSVTFSYKDFFVKANEVELVTSETVAPFVYPKVADTSELKSQKAEALATDIEKRRSGGGKACGLTAFGNAGCWACVGWSMTDVGLFPNGLGSDADGTPNGFLRATAAARARKAADGTVVINNVRFKSLKAEFGKTPSLAPRGSILFCNTSAAGHAAIITRPANEMRSDVIEVLGIGGRQSLCWDSVDEILFPLD